MINFIIFFYKHYFYNHNPFIIIKKYIYYKKQKNDFYKLPINTNFSQNLDYPCIFDNTDYTYIDPVYFFQDSWAAKMIFDLKPIHHYDIGSSIKTMGIISQFTPVTLIDIRPLQLNLPNLNFIKGNILHLPFRDNSLNSISSLCVLEHIGLGRYGDEIDPFGTEKAINEIKRVLSYDGTLLVSLPVHSNNYVYFNAHRTFTRDFILELFYPLKLVEEKYQYGNFLFEVYNPNKGFGTGMFLFKKLSNLN